ncbi:MAG TPA: adenylate/guanylate cyclase domain-containing protein [Alphaproteobacteria bacterium]|nr:adenylate/guanylate cyclase domain-containing protein [Alphaproteobacteria bacterium]
MGPRSPRKAALGALLLAGATALPLALARPPSPLAAAERLIQAVAFHLLAPAQPQSRDIAIIAITDRTLATLPYRSPIDRGFLADLITTLASSDPRAIGVDIVFDQPTEPAKDEALRTALTTAATPIVIASVASDSPLDRERRDYLDAFVFNRRAGFVNLARDRFDNQIREHEPLRPATGERSFAAELAIATGAAVPDRPFAIDWRHRSPDGPPFPVYPAEAAAQLPRSWLEGRILLIGTLIPGIDEHRTLFSAFGPPAHGVQIHAHILSQMLEGRVGGRRAGAVGIGVTAAMAASGMAIATWLGGWAMVGAVSGLTLLLWGIALAAFATGGPLVPLVAPTLAIVIGSGGVRFWRGRQAQRDRQMLMQLFSRFVGEPVLNQLMTERELLLAGGRPRPHELTATVLFTDIAGFTSVCERLDPDALIAWLDRYFDSMVQAVFAHDGLVLRFIGDGILCVFGAPLPRRSEAEIAADAVNAMQCAMHMKRILDGLNAEWRSAGLPAAGLRIGIHTGPLVAGSIGSGPHMEYSVLGDTVNIAARLETLGKSYGSGAADECIVLAGESTWDRLNGTYRGEHVGDVILRGKTQKVAVYRIDGLVTDSPANTGSTAISNHAAVAQ